MTQAANDIRKAINRYPEDPNAMLAMANALIEANHYGTAYHLMRRCVSASKTMASLVTYGKTLLLIAASAGEEKWVYQAERVFMDAVGRFPDSPEAIGALGMCALQLGRVDDARKLSLTALSMKPNLMGSVNALAMCYLYEQRWGEAFDLYERAIMPPMRFVPDDPYAPYWDGSPGKNLVVYGEQGLGDEISFASMISDAARENNVTFRCDPRLAGLFARSLPHVAVEGTRPTKINQKPMLQITGLYDAKCLSASLGRYYRRAAADFPRTGFLVADPDRRAYYRKQLDELPGKKIGIAWTGGLSPSFWHRRGLDHESLQKLLDIPGVTWVSLQYHGEVPEGVKQVAGTAMGMDYDETAALARRSGRRVHHLSRGRDW